MSPREFLDAVVRPNLDEFHRDCASLRHAHNAISAVDALAAHLFVWLQANKPEALTATNDSQYRHELANRNEQFAFLRDVAKAQKHVVLTQHNPIVSEADQVVSREIGYGEGGYGMGRYGGPAQVVAELDGGNIVYLESVFGDALAFLESEMEAVGI